MERWLGNYYTEELGSKTKADQSEEEHKKACDEIYAEAEKYIRKPVLDWLYDSGIFNKPIEEFHLDPIKIPYRDPIYNVLK